MSDFEHQLKRQLDGLCTDGLHRSLRRVDSPQCTRIRVGDQELLNFSSNDYLGLARDPEVCEAAVRATRDFGAGSGASRLICGSLAPHHELEESLAAFKGTPAALSFSSGYATAMGTIGALVGRDDVIIIDKLVHASGVDAARLCGAKLRVFAHNDLNELEDILRWTTDRRSAASSDGANRSRILIVTESVFSMDGDHAPLREIVALKEKHGAWLMVDEAHATGLYGPCRRGLAEELGVGDRIEIQMGTLGKALGASGGYVCGSRALIDLLVNRARSFIFSTAPVPAAAGAAMAAIRIAGSRAGEDRCSALWQRVGEFETSRERSGDARTPGAAGSMRIRSAIIPVIIGREEAAVIAADELRRRGFLIPAIRYPTVARGSARLRLTLTASHTREDVQRLAKALRDLNVDRPEPTLVVESHESAG